MLFTLSADFGVSSCRPASSVPGVTAVSVRTRHSGRRAPPHRGWRSGGECRRRLEDSLARHSSLTDLAIQTADTPKPRATWGSSQGAPTFSCDLDSAARGGREQPSGNGCTTTVLRRKHPHSTGRARTVKMHKPGLPGRRPGNCGHDSMANHPMPGLNRRRSAHACPVIYAAAGALGDGVRCCWAAGAWWRVRPWVASEGRHD